MPNKTMTKEELAARLNGCERRDDFPKELIEAARENNLVIIYGASDDLVCFAGAITDEADASDGGTFFLSKKGIPESDCTSDECPYYKRWLKQSIQSGRVKKVDVYWCGLRRGEPMPHDMYEKIGKPTWSYVCTQFHGQFATFDIFDTEGDDRDYFCRAVVIDLDQIWPPLSYEQMVM